MANDSNTPDSLQELQNTLLDISNSLGGGKDAQTQINSAFDNFKKTGDSQTLVNSLNQVSSTVNFSTAFDKAVKDVEAKTGTSQKSAAVDSNKEQFDKILKEYTDEAKKLNPAAAINSNGSDNDRIQTAFTEMREGENLPATPNSAADQSELTGLYKALGPATVRQMVNPISALVAEAQGSGVFNVPTGSNVTPANTPSNTQTNSPPQRSPG